MINKYIVLSRPKQTAFVLSLFILVLAMAFIPISHSALTFKTNGTIKLYNATIYSFTAEQGVPFIIHASFLVKNATFPIQIYLVVNGYVWGYPIITNSSVIASNFFITANPPPGVYNYYFLVIDSNGYGAFTSNGTFVIVPHISTSLSIKGGMVYENGAFVNGTLTINGGYKPYVNFWYFNGTLIGYNTTFLRIRLIQGVDNITVVTKDSLGGVSISTDLIKVFPGPMITNLSIPYIIDPNTPVFPNIKIEGGIPPYTIFYYLNGSKMLGNEIMATKSGIYNLTIFVEDSIGGTYVYTTFIDVAKPLTAFVSLSQSSFLYLQNGCFHINVNPSGGIPPYTVSYYLDGSFMGSGLTTKFCTTYPGRENLTISIQDSKGQVYTITRVVDIKFNLEVFIAIIGITVLLLIVFLLSLKYQKTYSKW